MSAAAIKPWTLNSHHDRCLNSSQSRHSLKQSEPQQTQSHTRTCPQQEMPNFNVCLQPYHQQIPEQPSSFQSWIDAQAVLQQCGVVLDRAYMDTSDFNVCGTETRSIAQAMSDSVSDPNRIDVSRLSAAHFDPSVEDRQLQQEIGHLYPMEQRTYDLLMESFCQVFMRQEGQRVEPFSSNLTGITGDMISSCLQNVGREQPMSSTFMQPQVR